jgi:flagellar motor protein MotB
MTKLAALALLFCSASALTEDIHPLTEVSPEEFHAMALNQETQAPPARKLIKKKEEKKLTQAERQEQKKHEKEAADRAEQRKKQREEEMVVVNDLIAKQAKEEEEIVKEATEKLVEQKEEAVEDSKTFHFPWTKKTVAPPKSTTPTFSLIKKGKALACTDGKKEVLSFYISSMAGGVSSRQALNRERCMRAQLDQHCMPYESFPATIVEPCDKGDWTCANKRVLNDHSSCLTKSVDWDAVQNYAKESGKTMWDVLGSWCSHVKLMKQITSRVQLDEKFADDYPAILVLEDHVILDKEWTEEIAKDFVNNYEGQWDMIQMDVLGAKGLKRDKVGEFREKPIYRPSWKGQYNGFHAVLYKTKSVPTILEKVQSLNVVPVEWLTKSMNDMRGGMEVLNWDAGISTTAWEGSRTLKESWMPNAAACEKARTHRMEY